MLRHPGLKGVPRSPKGHCIFLINSIRKSSLFAPGTRGGILRPATYWVTGRGPRDASDPRPLKRKYFMQSKFNIYANVTRRCPNTRGLGVSESLDTTFARQQWGPHKMEKLEIFVPECKTTILSISGRLRTRGAPTGNFECFPVTYYWRGLDPQLA